MARWNIVYTPDYGAENMKPALRNVLAGADCAVILGTGLGEAQFTGKRITTCSYKELPGVPTTAVRGHVPVVELLKYGTKHMLLFRALLSLLICLVQVRLLYRLKLYLVQLLRMNLSLFLR